MANRGGYQTLEILRQGTSGLAQSITQAGQARREKRRLEMAEAGMESEAQQRRLKEQREIRGASQVAENLAEIAQLPQTEFAKREVAELTPTQQRAQFAYNQIINPDPNIREQGIKEAFAISKELYLDPAEDRFKKLENRIVGLQVDAAEAEAQGDMKRAEQLRKEEQTLMPVFKNHLSLKTRLRSSSQEKPTNIAMAKWTAKQPLTEGEEALLIRYFTGPLQDLSKSGRITDRIFNNAQKFIRERGGYDKPIPGNSIGQPPLSNQQPGTEKRKLTGAEIAAEFAKIKIEDEPNLVITPPSTPSQVPQYNESDLKK